MWPFDSPREMVEEKRRERGKGKEREKRKRRGERRGNFAFGCERSEPVLVFVLKCGTDIFPNITFLNMQLRKIG